MPISRLGTTRPTISTEVLPPSSGATIGLPRAQMPSTATSGKLMGGVAGTGPIAVADRATASAPARISMPTRSNKGGALRGKERAAQVHALNEAKKKRARKPARFSS